MIKVYLSNVIGAPSPTAVIISEVPIDKIDWMEVAFKTFYYLQSKQVKFSKLAIIYSLSKSIFNFKFVQIKYKNGVVKLETNANCGNSMIASARVVYMLAEMRSEIQNNILLINIDTNLEVSVRKRGNYFDIKLNSLIGKSINLAKMFDGSEMVSVNESFGNINVSIVDIVNPYIIINAKEFGMKTGAKLLALEGNNEGILENIKKVRRDIMNKYNLEQNSEFPKIAMVLDDKELIARTIYLGRWHTGLPITAAISIAITSKMKNSVIYRKTLESKGILNPKGYRKVIVKIDNEGIISECEVLDIKSDGAIDTYIYDGKKNNI